MIITGIGSRQAPLHILSLFEEFGRYACTQEWFIRSGHARGCDYSFEVGAKENCIVYLPWKGFNKEDPILGIPRISPLRPEVLQMVYKYEPYAEKLSDAIKRIKSRNVYQVLGETLNTPSDCVVCWTKDAKEIGGTGLALKIAKSFNIPIVNLGNKSITLEELVCIIQNNENFNYN